MSVSTLGRLPISLHFCISSKQLFSPLSPPSGYFPDKAVCLFLKCQGTSDLLLLASFSPQIRLTGKPESKEVNAIKSVQALLIFYFLQIIFFLPFFILDLHGIKSHDTCTAFRQYRPALSKV